MIVPTTAHGFYQQELITFVLISELIKISIT